MRGEEISGLGHSWENRLSKRKGSPGLSLHSPVNSGDWSVLVSKASERRVDERVNLLRRLEPGSVGKVLPDGEVSGSGVPEEADGSHSDFGMLASVVGDSDEDGEDSLLNEFVGENISLFSVNSGNLLHALWDVEDLS